MKDRTRSNSSSPQAAQRTNTAAAPGKATRVERRYGGDGGGAQPVQAKPASGEGQISGMPAEHEPAEAGEPAASEGLSGARARFQAKETLRTQIEAQVTQEDAMREDCPTKSRTTRAQLTTQLANARTTCHAARVALDAGADYQAPLAAFEGAVDALHTDYLASSMESTDDPASPFAVNADLDVLGSSTAHAKMLLWQAASQTYYNGTVKFAVPPLASTGGVLVCRVGNPVTMAHNRVAGGDAIAAGFMRVSATGHTVTEFENTSGGYRPGSLRNATARAAIEAARPVAYTVVDGARHDNPTGSYDTSTIDERRP
jgi:hypothetical protein